MKEIIGSSALAVMVFCLGCGKSDETSTTDRQYTTPSTAAYRALLEKRAASVGGADINIRQETSRFENASDEEKCELYRRAEGFAQ